MLAVLWNNISKKYGKESTDMIIIKEKFGLSYLKLVQNMKILNIYSENKWELVF